MVFRKAASGILIFSFLVTPNLNMHAESYRANRARVRNMPAPREVPTSFKKMRPCEVNFIAFIIWPLYKQLISIFPELRSCGERVIDNQEKWFKEFSSKSTNGENLQRMRKQINAAQLELMSIPTINSPKTNI